MEFRYFTSLDGIVYKVQLGENAIVGIGETEVDQETYDAYMTDVLLEGDEF